MILPSLVLPDVAGKEVRTGDYRGRCNLVLFLSHPPGCERCQGTLQELAAGYGGLAAADAEVLAIIPGAAEETAILQLRLGIPFPVLVDAGAMAVRTLGGGAAVIVVDRFGEIFNLSRAGEGHEMMTVLEIADWLNFIEVQCPECGAPDWPGQTL
jgi:peroxiredoxin